MGIMEAERIPGGWVRATNDDRVEYFRAEAVTSISISGKGMHLVGPNITCLADSREQAETFARRLIELLGPELVLAVKTSPWVVGSTTADGNSPDGSATHGWAYAIASDNRPVPIWRAFRLRSYGFGWETTKEIAWRFLVEGTHPVMGHNNIILRTFEDHDEAMAFVRDFVPNFLDIPTKETP
jgi:hypothetical protein